MEVNRISLLFFYPSFDLNTQHHVDDHIVVDHPLLLQVVSILVVCHLLFYKKIMALPNKDNLAENIHSMYDMGKLIQIEEIALNVVDYRSVCKNDTSGHGCVSSWRGHERKGERKRCGEAMRAFVRAWRGRMIGERSNWHEEVRSIDLIKVSWKIPHKTEFQLSKSSWL